jgi:flagellar hook-basal body complex protein FliE
MEVDLFSVMPKPFAKAEKPKQETEEPSVYKIVADGLNKVNQLQHKSNFLTQQLVRGEVENIHDVMIAAREAEITLQFVMAIRNHLLRSYQEILAMGR